MILLVVGLVAVIVVILIAAVLSIRLGRDDEDDEPNETVAARGWRGQVSPRLRAEASRRAGDAQGGQWAGREMVGARSGRGAAAREGAGAGPRSMGDRSRDHAGSPRGGGAAAPGRAARPSPPVPPRGAAARPNGRDRAQRPPMMSSDDFPSQEIPAADYPSMDFPSQEFAAADYPSQEFAAPGFSAPDYPSAELPAARPARPAARDRDGERAPARKSARTVSTTSDEPAKGRSRQRGKRDDDDDWPSTSWDDLSDEQYWAELSADKPLSGMASKPARPAAAQARPPQAPPGSRSATRGGADGPRGGGDLPRTGRTQPSRPLALPAETRPSGQQSRTSQPAPAGGLAAQNGHQPRNGHPSRNGHQSPTGEQPRTGQPQRTAALPLPERAQGGRAGAAPRDAVTERISTRSPQPYPDGTPAPAEGLARLARTHAPEPTAALPTRQQYEPSRGPRPAESGLRPRPSGRAAGHARTDPGLTAVPSDSRTNPRLPAIQADPRTNPRLPAIQADPRSDPRLPGGGGESRYQPSRPHDSDRRGDPRTETAPPAVRADARADSGPYPVRDPRADSGPHAVRDPRADSGPHAVRDPRADSGSRAVRGDSRGDRRTPGMPGDSRPEPGLPAERTAPRTALAAASAAAYAPPDDDPLTSPNFAWAATASDSRSYGASRRARGSDTSQGPAQDTAAYQSRPAYGEPAPAGYGSQPGSAGHGRHGGADSRTVAHASDPYRGTAAPEPAPSYLSAGLPAAYPAPPAHVNGTQRSGMPGNGAPASGFPTHDVSRDDGWGGAPSPTLPAGGAASDPYYAQGYAPQPTGAYPAEPGYPASQGGDYGAAGLGHAAGYADPLTSAPAYAGGYGSQDNPYAEGVAAPPYPYSYHGANPAQGYDNGQQAEAYQEPGYNGYPSYG